MATATKLATPSDVYQVYNFDEPWNQKIYVHAEGSATNPFFEVVGSMWTTRITPWFTDEELAELEPDVIVV